MDNLLTREQVQGIADRGPERTTVAALERLADTALSYMNAVERAPHGEGCSSYADPAKCGRPKDMECRWSIANCLTHTPERFQCDCWKSRSGATK